MGESRADSVACFPYEKGKSHDHNSFPHIKCSFANLWAISMLDFTTSCKIYLNLSSELCIDVGGITVLSGQPFPMTRSLPAREHRFPLVATCMKIRILKTLL